MALSALRFHPDWKTTLLAASLLPVLIALGCWQLSRAEEKAQQAADWQMRMAGVERRVRGTLEPMPRYQRLVAQGKYDNAHSFLLDNRMRDGHFGYEVVTPLHLVGADEGDHVLLVSRGWLAGDPARRGLPVVAAVTGPVTVHGYAYDPQPGLVEALAENEVVWPVVAQWVDMEAFSSLLGQPLQPYVLRLSADSAGAFRTDWPLANLQPEQHIAYAVQWFAMAGMLVIAWLLLSTNLWAWWRGRRGSSHE